MSVAATEKRVQFRKLHAGPTFVIPNPWDIGSAKLLQHLGFFAVASTSAGFAWSIGKPDNAPSVDEVVEHLRQLCDAVAIPVAADFESGFSRTPQGVGENAAKAVRAGVAGLSIEDSTGDKASPLFPFNEAVERMRAARQAIDAVDSNVVLVGRSEGFIVGQPDLDETIRRLVAYSDAGADCLYAPGIRTREQITAVVQAVKPKPVNVLIGWPGTSVAELAELGVARISVGGSIARLAYSALMASAGEIKEKGTFTSFTGGTPGSEFNKILRGG